ncbi:hypothetical protein BDR06DRAFT_1011458 [Suillus hirtellus]|nr:hypothetical protein BDR06DRAFT_1011458 [Suillus hirtellus]
MPAVTTRSGRHIRRPPLPDQIKTHRKASDADDIKAIHGISKMVTPLPPPPLSHWPQDCYRRQPFRASTPVTGEHATTASKNPNAISQSQTNDLNGRNDNDQGTSATCTESHDAGYSNEDHGKDASGTSTESHYPEDGGNDDGHKTLATYTNGHPHRSGGVKSYAPDRSAAQQTSDHDVAANYGEDDEDSSEADPPSPPQLTAKKKRKLKAMVEVNEHHGSEDEDDKDFAKTKGRMPQVGILKVQELGKKMLEAAKTLGQEYGKSARTILIKAGLTMKATCKESPWNQHQTWFAATHPLPKGVLGVVSPEDVKAWKVKQQAHYKAHPQDDPQHASLWKEIQENWDRAVVGTTEDLTLRSAAGLMMSVHDAFTKLVRTSIVIYPDVFRILEMRIRLIRTYPN